MDYLLEQEQKLTDIVNEFNNKCEQDCRINRPRTINESVEGGSSLLSKCAMHGLTYLLERCIKLGSRLEDHDSYGRTALCWAIIENNTKSAEILLQSGANPNVKIKEHFSDHEVPIVFFIVNQNRFYHERLYLLLKYGAMIHEFHTFRFDKHTVHCFRKILAKRRWVIIKCATLILSLHKRAVERVNHPDRLKQQGYFELEI